MGDKSALNPALCLADSTEGLVRGMDGQQQQQQQQQQQ
jgi:hypothetical protein